MKRRSVSMTPHDELERAIERMEFFEECYACAQDREADAVAVAGYFYWAEEVDRLVEVIHG